MYVTAIVSYICYDTYIKDFLMVKAKSEILMIIIVCVIFHNLTEQEMEGIPT